MLARDMSSPARFARGWCQGVACLAATALLATALPVSSAGAEPFVTHLEWIHPKPETIDHFEVWFAFSPEEQLAPTVVSVGKPEHDGRFRWGIHIDEQSTVWIAIVAVDTQWGVEPAERLAPDRLATRPRSPGRAGPTGPGRVGRRTVRSNPLICLDPSVRPTLRAGGDWMRSSREAAREEFALARRRLIAQLRASGVEDPRVLAAMREVPRHWFVPEALWGQAYRDTPLPIGDGQTISAPGVVGTMTEALSLDGHERVLEIGTGSGYQAALLAHLAREVISIERIESLAREARAALDALGVGNVRIRLGDGTLGLPGDTPFERIVVTAGGPTLPRPLLGQLALGGILVGPFGARGQQELVRVQRVADQRFTREVLGRCRFVDLIGENGWTAGLAVAERDSVPRERPADRRARGGGLGARDEVAS